MKARPCHSCGGLVSPQASHCPHCGHPTGRPSETMMTRNRGCGDLLLYGLLALIGIPILFVILGAIFG